MGKKIKISLGKARQIVEGMFSSSAKHRADPPNGTGGPEKISAEKARKVIQQ